MKTYYSVSYKYDPDQQNIIEIDPFPFPVKDTSKPFDEFIEKMDYDYYTRYFDDEETAFKFLRMKWKEGHDKAMATK